MKLRIHGNSLRLRLNQSEVSQFSKTGFVEDSLQLGPGANFAYTLESSSSIPAPHASYQNGWFRIQVPAAVGIEWFTTDRVSIAGEQALANGKTLSILVEKDFQCLHGDVARDPDAYPNPLEEPVR
ncbi:MAG TPA: hypothetical protein VK724_25620 [Bryobacteraceae bacterium]|jgi:hypothetical protein|nr:hypothetical protein [Bryobacteraceae bacterium]